MRTFGRSTRNHLIFWAMALPIISICTTGCTSKKNKPASQEDSVTVTDFRGKEIKLTNPAKRVVCLIESALSGLYMLNAQEYVVGVPSDVYRGSVAKHYANLDHRLANALLPSPGNWDFVSLEQIIALHPDLVIIWASQTDAIANIERFEIPVYAVMLHSFEDVYKELSDFGLLFNRSERADSLISFTRNNLIKLAEQNKRDNPVRTYFMWAQGINHTSGKNSTVNQLLEAAGVVNIVDSDMEHLTVNVEKILEWNPELIIMWHNEKLLPGDVLAYPLLQTVSAVKSGKIFMLPTHFDCDLWTLKMQHAVKLVAYWAYGRETNNFFDEQKELEELLKILYPRYRL